MPAQPLTEEQIEDAKRLKQIYTSKKRELNLTQESLADACNWESQGTVSQYLNGKIPLNIPAALLFSKHLKCSIGEFSPSLAAQLEPVTSRAPEIATSGSLAADTRTVADAATGQISYRAAARHASAIQTLLNALSIPVSSLGHRQEMIEAIMNGKRTETFSSGHIKGALAEMWNRKAEDLREIDDGEVFAELCLSMLRAWKPLENFTKKK